MGRRFEPDGAHFHAVSVKPLVRWDWVCTRNVLRVDGVSLGVAAHSAVLKTATGARLRRGAAGTGTGAKGGPTVRKNIDVEVETGVVEKYRRHPNGNGWVSGKARVQPSAFISESAYIESGAQVGRDAWIGPGSWIDHDALIGDRVFIGQNVHIGQGTVVDGGAHLGSHARIGRDVHIGSGLRLERDARVPDGTAVRTAAPGAPGTPNHQLAA